MEILHDIETSAYCIDENSSDDSENSSDDPDIKLSIIKAILKWEDMLNCHLKAGVRYVL